METLSLRWFTTATRSGEQTAFFAVSPSEIARIATRWSVAGLTATVIFFATVIAAITPSLAPYLGAVLWATGLVFFALALEVGVKRILPYIATGFAVPALALLGSRIAPEFSMLAGAIVAIWAATWIAMRK